MKKLWIVIVVVIVVVVVLWWQLTPRRVDVEAERTVLRNLDSQTAQAAAAKDVERWLSSYADDAVRLPPNAPIIKGKEAIRARMSEVVAMPDFAVSWQATEVEVSQAGDLGYTLGTYELTMNDPEGKPVTDRGKYVAICKKQPDGSWKVVADIWNSDLPLPAPPKP